MITRATFDKEAVLEALGKEFDPELHDAMMQIASEDVPENHIAQEIQRGYSLKGKIIRHAKVIVSKGPEEAAASDSENVEDTEDIEK